jgi:hypothetical protein
MAKDLLTGEEFEPKKVTQKFATPENRIKYNNNKAAAERRAVAYVNDRLRDNKRILDKLMKGKDEYTFKQDYLLGKGYSFFVLTNLKVIDNQQYFCLYYYMIMNDNTDGSTKVVRYE